MLRSKEDPMGDSEESGTEAFEIEYVSKSGKTRELNED